MTCAVPVPAAAGDAVHDWYHVEPQYECLVDNAGQLVVDHILRCAIRAPSALIMLCLPSGDPSLEPVSKLPVGPDGRVDRPRTPVTACALTSLALAIMTPRDARG